MMSPKSPRTELKISITRTLTNLKRKGISLFVPSTLPATHPRGRRGFGGEDDSINSQARIGGVGQRCTAAIYSNRNTAYEVTHPHRQSGPEERIARIEISARVYILTVDRSKFCRKDNSHNHPVDGDNFAKNYRDQVLRSYSRRLYASA